MKITIFAVTPHAYGIPMFDVHGLDKANAVVAKLRERSPTWEFFATELIRTKHAVSRTHFVERTDSSDECR